MSANNFKDISKQRFGCLEVIEKSGKDKWGQAIWRCKCDCGNYTEVTGCGLRGGNTKSCGCFSKKLTSERFKKYNTFYEKDDYMVGITAKGLEFYFDKEDYEKIKDICWYINRDYVVSKSKSRKSISLHRLIINPTEDMFVDHEDGNPLNNRRNNLRIASNTENSRNSSKPRGKHSSLYKGVSWDKSRGKWVSSIMVNRKHIHLGRYLTEEEAALAYNEGATRYFKEFAKLNEVKEVVICLQ